MGERLQQLVLPDATDSPSKQPPQEWVAAAEEGAMEEEEILVNTVTTHKEVRDGGGIGLTNSGESATLDAAPAQLGGGDFGAAPVFGFSGSLGSSTSVWSGVRVTKDDGVDGSSYGQQFELPSRPAPSSPVCSSKAMIKMEPDLLDGFRFDSHVDTRGNKQVIFGSEAAVNPFNSQVRSVPAMRRFDPGFGDFTMEQPEVSPRDAADAFLENLGQSEGDSDADIAEKELINLAANIGINATFEVVPQGSSHFCASINLEYINLSVPGNFTSPGEAKASVCRQGIYLLKARMATWHESRTSVGMNANVGATSGNNEESNVAACHEPNVEMDWIGTLHNFAVKEKSGAVRFLICRGRRCDDHPRALPRMRYDVVVGTKTYSCPGWYHVSQVARMAAAKYAMKELYINGAPIDIPKGVVSQLQWKQRGYDWYSASTPQIRKKEEVPEKKRMRSSNGKSARRMALNKREVPQKRLLRSHARLAHNLEFSELRPKANAAGENSNMIPLTRLRIQQPTDEEILARSMPQGREPEGLESLVVKINRICGDFKIERPMYEIIADNLEGNTFSGSAIFQPHPLITNSRAGKVLHVYGKQRAQEFCALGVLAVLETITAAGSQTGSENRKRPVDEEAAENGKKTKIERREQSVEGWHGETDDSDADFVS